MLIVGARLTAEKRQALAIGWHARNLHYVKELKPLEHYLKPAATPEQKRDKDARAVARMLDGMIRKQEATNGTR